jgi:hypothetical protein
MSYFVDYNNEGGYLIVVNKEQKDPPEVKDEIKIEVKIEETKKLPKSELNQQWKLRAEFWVAEPIPLVTPLLSSGIGVCGEISEDLVKDF